MRTGEGEYFEELEPRSREVTNRDRFRRFEAPDGVCKVRTLLVLSTRQAGKKGFVRRNGHVFGICKVAVEMLLS